MIFYIKEKHQRYFKENLEDWCAGGPKDGGWTRVGPSVSIPNLELASCRKGMILVDDVLAKNRSEVERWHLSFLDGNPQSYFAEYLDTRYEEDLADERAKSFLDLLEDIRENGFDDKHPVCVADVSNTNLGMRYFRFDGCHRACCAKHLGINEVPAYIFTTEESAKN